MSFILQERVSLKPFNTFGVDARAAWLARVHSVEDLQRLQEDPRVRHVPRLILGGGSNILFAGNFAGLVIQVALRGVDDAVRVDEGYLVRVAAGESWPALVELLLRCGRPGLENLAMIPGSAGAAPIQNIGAYGIELAERLHSVTVWDMGTGECRELAADACGFGYRQSVFKNDQEGERVILAITLRLPLHSEAVTGYAELERELSLRGCKRPAAGDVFDAVCALRRRKLPDPVVLGSAGSFFKNPVVARTRHAQLLEHFPSLVSYPLAGGRFKIAAAWMIEACQFKGVTRGRAGVHENQPLVLVNRGGARGADVLELAREIQAGVQAKFGITLEPEVRIVGGEAQDRR